MAISDKYGDDRRTSIGYDESEINMEDLIPNESTVIAMTNLGYIKRMTLDNFKSQNRGGRGIKGMQTIDEDYIEDLFMTTTHKNLLFCTSRYGWGWKNFLKEADTGEGLKFPKWAKLYVSYILPLIVLFIFVQGYISKFM